MDETTAEGFFTPDTTNATLDLATGGVTGLLQDVGTIAQSAANTTLQVKQAAAVAGTNVVSVPGTMYVNPSTGSTFMSGISNATPTEKLMLLLAVVAIALGISHHHSSKAAA